jgi:hypothetical protein
MTSAADNPGGTVAGREVPAFDLYGTLVDPIAVSSELYDHLQPFPDTVPALRAR